MPSWVPVERLSEDPYRHILEYPRASHAGVSSRLGELRAMGVKSVRFAGGVTISGLDVLGKGFVGVVVQAETSAGEAALKIRRVDSPRRNMYPEAGFTRLANGAGVGPRLLGSSENFVLMEYLDGAGIGEWSRQIKDAGVLRGVVRSVLEDCFELDRMGLDHGELVNISKHVIVGKKATIIDFESSSMERRAANVTSAAQSLYVGSGIARRIGQICQIPDAGKTIGVLRRYKRNLTRESFGDVLGVLGV